MKTYERKTYLASFLLLFLASCVTINIYFPAAAVEKAADRIVEEVWGNRETRPPEPEGQEKKSEPQGLMERVINISLQMAGPEEVFAEEADINVTTPAIRALKESIRARAESLKPYMDSGHIGLTGDGLLTLRSGEGLNLKEKAELNRLVDAENKDRNSLYAEIAKANNFPPERITDIKEIFSKSWTSQAKQGWWVQGPDGQWKKKE